MFSLTGEYALRAMIFLAQHVNDWPIPGRTIADETQIPRKYLSSILGTLVRARILDSSPGRGGGFSMIRPPQKIRLAEVLSPFEPTLGTRRPCPFGREECDEQNPCAGHHQWKNVREAYARFLEKTSILSVALKDTRRPSPKSKKRTKR